MHEGFLRNIVENPQDDDIRLVYADYLEENGQPERAEFIKLQIRLAHFPTPVEERQQYGPVRQAMREALRHRERELLEAHGHKWIDSFVRALFPDRPVVDDGWRFDESRHPFLWRTSSGDVEAAFHRGFIDRVTCPLEVWCGTECDMPPGIHPPGSNCPQCHGTGRVGAHGLALSQAAPLERVTLTDRGPQDYHNNGAAHLYGWWRMHDRDMPCPPRSYDLPDVLWQFVARNPECDCHGENWADFLSPRLALDALSAAALAWARAQPLPTPA